MSDDANLRLQKVQTLRKRLAERLRSEDEDGLASILECCGENMPLVCTCCGEQRIVETRCKKRWCPVCARTISAKRVAKYKNAVESMQWPIFVTLTRPNLAKLHLSHIKEMRRGYRRLRQRAWWNRAVLGGIASVEITNIGNGWHPHIHSILDARWLAKTIPAPKPFETRATTKNKCLQAAKEVAAEWASAMRLPEARVHVKRAYTQRTTPDMPGKNQSITVEILKYACKSEDLIECQEPIGDLIRLMGAARLVSSFGSCYDKDLDDEETPYEGGACKCGATGTWLPESLVDRVIRKYRRDK